MSLLIDPRAGSIDLIAPLRSMSLPVKRRRLAFGDVAFRGNDAHGRAWIGIEYKKLSDFLACISDKRLVSHQLPGMLRTYDHSLLLIEGVIRPDRFGLLEVFSTWRPKNGRPEMGGWSEVRNRMTYAAVRRYCFTLAQHAGVSVDFTSGLADTLGYIASLYTWYQKPWGDHHAHLALPAREDSHPRAIHALMRRPSVRRRLASVLPGIGWVRSELIASRFPNADSMLRWILGAREKEWAEIPGIGPKTARAIHRALHTGERNFTLHKGGK